MTNKGQKVHIAIYKGRSRMKYNCSSLKLLYELYELHYILCAVQAVSSVAGDMCSYHQHLFISIVIFATLCEGWPCKGNTQVCCARRQYRWQEFTFFTCFSSRHPSKWSDLKSALGLFSHPRISSPPGGVEENGLTIPNWIWSTCSVEFSPSPCFITSAT